VEDDAAVLETTKAMLMRLGYQVLTATNGQNALELYEQYQAEIGLVLTDITMPDMDGTALSQILYQKTPTIKIIALTGYPLETSREASIWQAQGISDWLQKPVTLVLRPECARVAVPDSGTARTSVVSGRVTSRLFTGQSYRIGVETSAGVQMVFDLPNENPPPAVGRKVDLNLKPSGMVVIESS
jgi:CheY-like chemotaxis protein